MQNEGLKIIVSSDVQQAIRDFQNLTNVVDTLGQETADAMNRAQAAIAQLGSGSVSINRLSQALNVFRVAADHATDVTNLQSYNRNIQLLEQEISRLNSLGRTTAANGIAAVGTSSRVSGQAMMNFGRIMSDLPYGFIAIQNNIDPLVQSLGLGGGLALGITLLGTAFTFLTQKYGGLGKAFQSITGNITDSQRAIEDYTASIAGASDEYKTAVANVGELRNSIALAKEGFISKKEVVDRYNTTIGKTTGFVKTLDEAESALAKNADAYIKFTLLKAAAQTALQKAAEQAFKAEQERQKSDQESVPYILSGLTNSQDAGVNKLYKDAGKRAREEAAKVFEKDQTTFEAIAKNLQEQAAKISSQFKFNFYDQTQSKKTGETQESILDKLQKKLLDLDATFTATNGDIRQLQVEKIKALGDAVGELVKIGVSPGSSAISAIKEQIDLYQSNLAPHKVKIDIPVEVLPKASNTGTLENLSNNLSTKFKPYLNEFTKEINKTINDGLLSGLDDMFSNIGKAFTGGGFSNIIKGVVQSIASLGKALGKQLIAQGLAIEAFKASLKSLNGIAAVVAGGALIVASAAFENLASKGIGSFATGGVAVGPQLAVIGDNPSRREAIVPEEMWGGNNAISNGYIATTSVSLKDLNIGIKRAQRNG